MQSFKHQTFFDKRGSYTAISTKELNINWDQCSISVNDNPFTFRGMHYQSNPAQIKYVKVVEGKIVDFAYNLKTGELIHKELMPNDAVLITNEFAHGFLTLFPNTIISYLVKGEYSPESEHSIIWSEITELKSIIERYIGNQKLIISDKDKQGK